MGNSKFSKNTQIKEFFDFFERFIHKRTEVSSNDGGAALYALCNPSIPAKICLPIARKLMSWGANLDYVDPFSNS